MSRIGLIAGNGRFPFLVLDAARRLGHDVTVLTTAAYGALPDDEAPQSDGPGGDIVRTADLQLVRARLRGHQSDGRWRVEFRAGGLRL